jgi:hypothetical protein
MEGARWSKRKFERKLAKAKKYAEDNPCGFVLNMDDWQLPGNRHRRVIVEGVRAAFKDNGLDPERGWPHGGFEPCSVYLRANPNLGISFAAIETEYDTYAGLAGVHYGEDDYDRRLGLMIALYRAAYRYGKWKCGKIRDILVSSAETAATIIAKRRNPRSPQAVAKIKNIDIDSI